MKRRVFWLGGAVFVVVAGIITSNLLPQPLETQPVFVADGVAIGGTDPVAYFTEERAVAGSQAHSAQWNGATWWFVSVDNRDQFTANPEMFAPQYGGFCAWAVAEKGELYSTQPENWRIVDRKLYLNYNDDVQELWLQDVPGFIAKGDQAWPTILAGPS